MFAPITPSNWKDPVQDLFVPRRFNPTTKEIADLGVRFGTLNADMRPKVVEITSGKGFNPVPFTVINPYLQEPYSMTYTLGIQRELMQDMVLEVDYVGQRGVKFPLFRAVENDEV